MSTRIATAVVGVVSAGHGENRPIRINGSEKNAVKRQFGSDFIGRLLKHGYRLRSKSLSGLDADVKSKKVEIDNAFSKLRITLVVLRRKKT
jgi:hypothetical protein